MKEEEKNKIQAILMDLASQMVEVNPSLTVWFEEISEAIREI